MWLWSRGRIVRRTREGTPSDLIGIDTDITAIKEAERQAKEAAERLAVAEKVANLGRWEFDAATRSFVFNDRLMQILGHDDGGGQPLDAARFHPEDLPRVTGTFVSQVRR